jgi:protein-S-isoprenylcysteine O-methyltransferase Ste14
MELAVFYTFFGTCFICFAIRTLHCVLKNRGGEIAESSRVVKAIFVVMFFVWSGWTGMVLGDPYEMHPATWLRYTGLAVFIIGVSFFIIGHVRIVGGGSQGLVTGGIYSKLRHPVYTGFIFWVLGLPIFANSLFTLASSVLWIPQFLYWGRSEDQELARKYEGYYEEYRKKTWF